LVALVLVEHAIELLHDPLGISAELLLPGFPLANPLKRRRLLGVNHR
jgi:hypothetical protein